MRRWGPIIALVSLALVGARSAWAAEIVTVGYGSPSALRGVTVLERLGPLHAAEVSTSDVAALRQREGIRWVSRTVARAHLGEPALVPVAGTTTALEWQYAATREDLVPASVQRAAAGITIAVIDTGADVTAPDLAAKSPVTYNVISGDASVSDPLGHGTFVASIAAGSVTNGDGIAGFGGDARLMIVQANRDANTFTDVDEAAGVVWAVDHGAQIVNLSIGGTQTSQIERDAIDYAIAHNVLLVAAAGNNGAYENQPSYPAALLVSHGIAVGASTPSGRRASFSTGGPYVAMGAPGVHILGALSPTASSVTYPRAAVPGSVDGVFGFGSGTSYSAPQVAGAAALVWAADPTLTADGVARILELTASGRGVWTPQLGYGVLDVASAVARASGLPAPSPVQPTAVASTQSIPRGALHVAAATRARTRNKGL